MGGRSHILSHFEEKYYVPSLAENAVRDSSPAARQTVQAHLLKKPEYAFPQSMIGVQVQRAIYKHCLTELGLSR